MEMELSSSHHPPGMDQYVRKSVVTLSRHLCEGYLHLLDCGISWPYSLSSRGPRICKTDQRRIEDVSSVIFSSTGARV